MAEIQFSKGIAESTIPNIRLTRSRNGENGTATFYFESPQAFNAESTEEITGMYLVDEEGAVVTREVKAKFVNGKPAAIEAMLIMNSAEQWDRFMRFMERYAQEHGLEFRKA
jgi:photosystem II protein